ncbi:uncharacterized protein LOC124293010 [Neodiprion lecontei]|uniref:Uncharacterized protein LOC124293010 n=1 Tax=Neodiprion lecontei TaxID=441921 RepID=A0ABM3FIK8_NEOLC|nr:uncharacterized protein LOC124293010 [Neodiprion lecontei]
MDATLRRLLFIGTLLILAMRPGNSFVAYDCGAPSMNITTLSLINIKECNIPISNPVAIDTNIQLLQVAEFSSVKVIQCKVEIHRSVFHCGMHSHTSAVSYGDIEYIDEISRDACRDLHYARSYRTHRQLFTQIRLNSTTSRPIVLAGDVDNSGNCKGEHFSDHYGSWNDVVAYGQIFITLQDYEATVNIQRNEIILRSGVRCEYSSGNCIDVEGGNTYWDIIQADRCSFEKYSVLYQGAAQKIKDNTIGKYGQEICSVTTNDITFALSVRGTYPLCGYRLIKTEHPKLFILDKMTGNLFTKINGITVRNMDIFTYVNSKLIYLERHVRNQIIALYNDAILQQCELENKVLHTALSTAPLAPAEFAFHLMKQPGYIAYIAGEVVRVAKCVPVDVRTRKTNECYQELPIFRGNESLFMLARTHILVKSGNQIECNVFLSPMFNIDNAWYSTSPNLIPAIAPDEMSTNTKKSWKYVTPENLATGGIYSNEDIEKLRANIMFPVEKPAVLNTIAREATGQISADHGLSVNSLIDKEAIKRSLEEAWGTVYNFFNTVGTFSATLLGAWITFREIKFLIDTLVHGYALHLVYGWSMWLIGAIWDSVTNLLLHLSKRSGEVRRTRERNSELEMQTIEITNNTNILENQSNIDALSKQSSKSELNKTSEQTLPTPSGSDGRHYI